MKGRTIKDLKDLRGQGIAARYRHLGPKGPNVYRLRSPERNGTGSGDPALQIWGEAAVCRCRLRSPERNGTGLGAPVLQSWGEAAVCCRCRLRSPERNRSRSGDLDLQSMGPRGPRENARGTGPRATIPDNKQARLETAPTDEMRG